MIHDERIHISRLIRNSTKERVRMGMTWPWRQHPWDLSSGRRLVARWFALLERDRPPSIGGEPPHADASSQDSQGASDFEAFFLRYDRQITNYLWRMTGDEQIASELAQETFLRAWQHFEIVRHYEQPIAWLFRVATNLARQHHRRHAAPVGMAAALTDDDAAALAGDDPATRLAEQDLVRQILLQLPIRQRAALILREVYGFSCAEVATLLNISRDAVKMALWRARERFRIRYLREDEEGEA
jgi:RNA polymerase sigma-70 factor, ECF subfamily